MDQRADNACGSHGFANGKPVFDYTCDDCMLPWNHYDPEEINDIDHTDNKEGTTQNKKFAQTDEPPF